MTNNQTMTDARRLADARSLARARFTNKAIWWAVAVFIAILLVGPFIIMVLASFQRSRTFFTSPWDWLPTDPTLFNYQILFERSKVIRWTLNSLLISTVPIAINVSMSLLLGYIFARKQFRGKEIIFWLFLSSLMIPFQVTLAPLYLMMNAIDWLDTYWVLMVPGLVQVTGMFLMRQFMQDIPTDYIEAAEIDGCSQYRTFFSVIFPMVRPAAAALCIFLFMASYNSFLWPLISVNSRDLFTLPVGMSALNSDRGSQMDLMMACATMVVAPVCVIFALAQKNFVAGLTMGGVKG